MDILKQFAEVARTPVELAKLLAHHFHEGQWRKVEDEPYIVHPARIVAQLDNERDQCIAWLHDVVEDCDVTLEELQPYFSDDVIAGIDALTKVPGDEAATLEKIRNAPKYVQRIKLLDVIDYWQHCKGMPAESIEKHRRVAKEFYLELANTLDSDLYESLTSLIART